MATSPNFILQSLGALIMMSPMLLFYLVAMIVSFVYWNRHQRVCLLVLLAVGLMMFTSIGSMVLQWYLFNALQANQRGGMTLGYVLRAISLVSTIIRTGGLGLLLLAVFTDRPRPVNPAAPSDPGNLIQ